MPVVTPWSTAADAAGDLGDAVEDGIDQTRELIKHLEDEPENKENRKVAEELLDAIEVKPNKDVVSITLGLDMDGVELVGVVTALSIPAFVKYTRKAKTSEARMNIRKIADAAAAYYAEEHVTAAGEVLPPGFPETADWTPPLGSCCKGDDGRCRPDPDLWAEMTWLALGFSIDDPHYYSYRFEATGTGADAEFKVSASGDLDCDGKYSLFETGGVIEGDGVSIHSGIYIEDETE